LVLIYLKIELNDQLNKIEMNIPNTFNAPFKDIGQFISSVLPNLLVVAGVVFFFLMFGGGFMMIHGAGNDDAKQVAQGKAAVTAAVIGFLLVISAYFILQILKVLTGIDFLSPPANL